MGAIASTTPNTSPVQDTAKEAIARPFVFLCEIGGLGGGQSDSVPWPVGPRLGGVTLPFLSVHPKELEPVP